LTNALLLDTIATQRSQMFAGSSLDRQRLIAPRWARTRVHVTDVLEHVRLTGRSLHFDRLASF
jgi:hypothetical protein